MRPQNTIVLLPKYYYLFFSCRRVTKNLGILISFNFFPPSNLKKKLPETNKKYLLPNNCITYYHTLFLLLLYNMITKHPPLQSFCFEYFFPCIYEMLHHLVLYLILFPFFAQVLSSSQNFNVQLTTKKTLNESCVAPTSMIEKNISFYC